MNTCVFASHNEFSECRTGILVDTGLTVLTEVLVFVYYGKKDMVNGDAVNYI